MQVDLAGRIPHAWLPIAGTSTLDLLGPGLTLFTTGASRWHHAAGTLGVAVPLAVREVDAVTARTIGVTAHGALLVRPDGVPLALWRTDDQADRHLDAAVRSLVDAPATGGSTARHVA